MERESFENPDIAQIMNEHFINIKVDREERPDLDDIYQKSAQAFMRRGGGWPLTVFLAPDQEPFWGGTYFPPTPRYGMPGFPEVLLGVAEAYKKEHEQVQQNVHKVRAGLRHISSPQPSNQPLTQELLDGAVKDLSAFYEPVNGGFGDAPKFPTPPPFHMLLRQFGRAKDPPPLDMTLHSLWKMAAGGIYDHLGGGFHRYSTDGQWLVPHFEKMLYDNAQLVRLYLDGWRLSREPRFKQVVEETLAYIRREMVHPDGGFYTARDADSEGHEGKYFVWEPAEIKSVLGAELGEVFCQVYDITDGGNFEGKNIPNLIHANGRIEVKDLPDAEKVIAEARRKLLEVRERRVEPQRDDQILHRMKTGEDSAIASGNAVATMNFLRLFFYTGEQNYMDKAEQTLRLFRTHMDQNPFGMASTLCALDFYLSRPKEVVLVGKQDTPEMKDLLAKIAGRYVPNRTLVLVDSDGKGARYVPAAAKGKTAINDKPTAYVCHNFTCSQPVTAWDALEKLL